MELTDEQTKTLNNIKERLDKVYTLADESLHVMLASMQTDIKDLIKIVESNDERV